MTRRPPVAASSVSFAADADDGSSATDTDESMSFEFNADDDDDDDDDDNDKDGALPSTMRPVNQRPTSAYQQRKRSPRRQRLCIDSRKMGDGTAHSGRPSLLAYSRSNSSSCELSGTDVIGSADGTCENAAAVAAEGDSGEAACVEGHSWVAVGGGGW